MQYIAEKLMNIRDTSSDSVQPTFSAIFGTTQETLLPSTGTKARYRLAMWPALSEEDPVNAMGLMSVVAMLLEQWEQVIVYRLFAQLKGKPEDYVWDISQSQFEIEDWHPEPLDDNVGIWGVLEKTGDMWQFTLEAESDLSSSDDIISISKTAASISELCNWLPDAAHDIITQIGLDSSPRIPYRTDVLRFDEDTTPLLADVFYWELQLLLALWGRAENIPNAYAHLLQDDKRLSDDFHAWVVASAVTRSMLPGFVDVQRQLPPIEDILTWFGTNAAAAPLLARALYSTGKGREAVDLLEAVVEAHPDEVNAWNTLADLYRQSGDMPNALDTYQRALEMDSISVSLLLNYAQLLPIMEGSGYEVEEFVLIEPEELNADYMTWEAIEAYAEASRRTPNNPTAILAAQAVLLTDVVTTEEHMERLWRVFRALVSYDSEGEFVRQVVDGFSSLENIESGLEILEDALEQSPQRVDLRVTLAVAYLTCEEVDHGLSELEQAAAQTDDPYLLGDIERLILVANDPEFEILFGEISDKINAGNPPNHDDLDFLEAAKENAPNYIDPFLVVGKGYILREELTDALETLLDAQKRFPSDPDVLEALASVLCDTNEYDSALSYLKRGLITHPDHVPLLSRMGQLMFDMDDLSSARAFLQRAEAISPRHPAFLRARKYVAEQMRDYSDDNYEYDEDRE